MPATPARLLLAALLATRLATASPLSFTWIGSDGGNWAALSPDNSRSNWSPNPVAGHALPTLGDTASLNGHTVVVTDQRGISTLNLGGGALLIGKGALLQVNSFVDGAGGRIQVGDAGGSATLLAQSVRFNNTNIQLVNGSTWDAGGNTLGAGSLVNGTGTMTTGHMPGAIEAGAAIRADATGQTLLFYSASFRGPGTYEATNGGTLQLGYHAYLDGGTVHAADGSTVLLSPWGSGAASIKNAALSTAGTGVISVLGNSQLQNISNTGRIEIGAATGGGVSLIEGIANNGSISAGATIVTLNNTAFSGNGSLSLNGTTTGLSGTITNGPAHTLQGSGTLQGGTIVNQGTLSANLRGQSLVFSSNTINNSGTLRAENGGTLQFGYHSTVSGGTLEARDGSVVAFRPWGSGPATGSNLTFNTSGSGLIESNSNTYLSNITNNGDFYLRPSSGAGTTFSGSLVNNGRIFADNGAIATFNGATLSGGGTLTAKGLTVGGGALTNQSTLQGTISFGGGTFLNQGTLRATAGDSIWFAQNGWSNQGIVRVDAGGSLGMSWRMGSVFANFNQSTSTLSGGTWDVAGTLRLTDGNLVHNQANLILDGPSARLLDASGRNMLLTFNDNQGSFSIRNGYNFNGPNSFKNSGTVEIGAGSTFTTGTYTQTATGKTILNGDLRAGTLNLLGTLQGNGTLHAGLIVGGTLSPGNSPGTLTIDGDTTLTSTSELILELGASAHDQLIITGDLALDGILRILLAGYSGHDGDELALLHWGGTISGAFASISLPTLAGYHLDLRWAAHDLYLTVAGAGVPSPVPEPAPVLLLAAGLALLALRFRQCKR